MILPKVTTHLLLLIIPLYVQAQQVVNPGTKINFEELRFKGKESTAFKIGDPSLQMVLSLGEADSVVDFYYEMDEVHGKLYMYGNNKLYFQEDKFYSWEIVNDKISIGRNDRYFKRGDPIDKVLAAFPEFVNKSIQDAHLIIPLRSKDYDMECSHISIFFYLGEVNKISKYEC